MYTEHDDFSTQMAMRQSGVLPNEEFSCMGNNVIRLHCLAAQTLLPCCRKSAPLAAVARAQVGPAPRTCAQIRIFHYMIHAKPHFCLPGHSRAEKRLLPSTPAGSVAPRWCLSALSCSRRTTAPHLARQRRTVLESSRSASGGALALLRVAPRGLRAS